MTTPNWPFPSPSQPMRDEPPPPIREPKPDPREFEEAPF